MKNELGLEMAAEYNPCASYGPISSNFVLVPKIRIRSDFHSITEEQRFETNQWLEERFGCREKPITMESLYYDGSV